MTIAICEVSPRDGLQNEQRTVKAALRAELIDRLAGAGIKWIEAVSFVDPRRVPQMAGAEQVVDALRRQPGVTYAGLVLNERGYDRLAATGLDAVHYAFAVTETFNRRNQNASVEQSLRTAAAIAQRAADDRRRIRVIIGAAFGCPFEGEVSPARVLAHAERLAAAGVHEIVFADTIGVGVPGQVRRLVDGGLRLGLPIGLHLHNTRNTGLVNALVGLEAGATVLDGAVGGVGGCPFAPGAAGNIATEDLVYLLERQGLALGLDLDKLIRIATWLAGQLRHDLPGQLHRAGPWPPSKAADASAADSNGDLR